MHDTTPRLIKAGDALSQMCNVLFLPNHHETDANESISGRSHRMSWHRTERTIDTLFWVIFGQEGHCRKAYYKDLERARRKLRRHRDRSLVHEIEVVSCPHTKRSG